VTGEKEGGDRFRANRPVLCDDEAIVVRGYMKNVKRWFPDALWLHERGHNPLILFAKALTAVCVAETFAMLVLQFMLPSLSALASTLLDNLILVSLLFPCLFILIFKPLLHEMAERKRVEKSLEELLVELNGRKVFIESILGNIHSGIIVTDLEMRILLANDYALRFLGKSSSELNGMELDETCAGIAASIISGINDAELPLNADPHGPIVGFKRVDLKRPDGAVVGHVITFVDLSEIIKVRNEMRLKERLAAMGEVVARVAHEMRNPLFGITAAAQILAMELKLTEPQKELMTSLFGEAKRMNHLVEELLDCSKEMKLKKTPFDLIKSLNDSLSFNECFTREKTLEVHTFLPAGELRIVADPERIKQVMVNILKNAVDATPPGGAITVKVEETGGNVSIQVRDTGPGIPENILEKIFDVFYTTKRRGSGLGLSISRKIVDAHGGTLTAMNSAGGGAAFTIVLPTGDGL
jgi:signal transduction histidine kinase